MASTLICPRLLLDERQVDGVVQTGVVLLHVWRAGDQKPRIDDGMIADVQAFAAYAPFCDAFTVDSCFAHMLRTSPMKDRLPSDTAIFGARELDALEGWLIGVERAAPTGHFDLLSAIYAPAGLSRMPPSSIPPRPGEDAP